MAHGGAGAIPAQDREHDTVVRHVRFRETPEVAKLGAAERLHARARRMGHLGQIGIVGAGIDRGMKGFVDSW